VKREVREGSGGRGTDGMFKGHKGIDRFLRESVREWGTERQRRVVHLRAWPGAQSPHRSVGS
jgi:hypothetical protein